MAGGSDSDFFTASFTTRFGSGIDLGGSVDTGRTVDDQCFVVDSPGVMVTGTAFSPNTDTTINGERLCHTVTPFGGQTQIKMTGAIR